MGPFRFLVTEKWITAHYHLQPRLLCSERTFKGRSAHIGPSIRDRLSQLSHAPQTIVQPHRWVCEREQKFNLSFFMVCHRAPVPNPSAASVRGEIWLRFCLMRVFSNKKGIPYTSVGGERA